MNINIDTIDTNLLTKQHALISTLIESLSNGRTGIAIKRDLTTLIGIQGILDALADSVDFTPPADGSTIANLARKIVEGRSYQELVSCAESGLYDFWSSPAGADDLERCMEEYGDCEGPECSGCTHPGNCDNCEYGNN